jgi:hypothetical protein
MSSTKMNERVWTVIRAATTPVTTPEVAAQMGLKVADVSQAFTDLYRRDMLNKSRRTFINDNARQQTLAQYTAIGDKFALKPLKVIAAKTAKKEAWEPPKMPEPSRLEVLRARVDDVPIGKPPVPNFSAEFDPESFLHGLSLSKCKALYVYLNGVFK